MLLPQAIIVTGTPGVGKTLVSKALTERLGGYYLSVTDLAKKENLVLRADSERNTMVADIRRLSDRIKTIICTSPFDVVVDGHYASDVVSSDLVSYAFVLRIHPDTLRERLRARGYSTEKVLENVASEVLGVCLSDAVARFGVTKVDEIDVSHRAVADIVEEILAVLTGRVEAGVGKVDWLGKWEEERRLSEVFP